MKRKTFFALLSLALVLSMLLSGCGQAQMSVPPSENDNVVNTPTADTVTPDDEQEAPEFSQPVIKDESAEGANRGESETDEETSSPNENVSVESTPAPEESASEQETTQVPEQTPVPEPTPAPTPAPVTPEPPPESTPEPAPEPEPEPIETAGSDTTLSGTTLTLRFGGGESFTINMYDNDTANKIAEYVGTAAWQLPIYHYDDYTGWESFQYYDIPSRYDIPDGSRTVTSEKAGAVYYSHPNRIILFYQDANISNEYTPVGYIDFSEDLVDAVENNPVVEGWSNKLIFIQP